MLNIKYNIETSTISPLTYKVPLVEIDTDGQPKLQYSKHVSSYKYIKSIRLLNLVGRNEKEKIVSFEPLEMVNTYLLERHFIKGNEESGQDSNALVHYFSFILNEQEKWDKEYYEETFEEHIDEPRPSWDYFSPIKSNKITFRYRAALKYAVEKEQNENLKIKPSTAINYINVIRRFYTFHIRSGYKFNNEPFQYKTVKVELSNSGSNMQATRTIYVPSSDLKLSFPKNTRNQSGTLENYPRELRPLSEREWKAVERVLRETKKVLKVVKGETKLVKLAEEFCLIFEVCRYTGLRREEAASLILPQIVKPKTTVIDKQEFFKKPMIKLGVGGRYGSLSKSPGTEDNKSRETIIPSSLMLRLYEYTRSERYQKRLIKFKNYCTKQKELGNYGIFEGPDGIDEQKDYLFISNSGIPLFRSINSINARWAEIRNTVNKSLPNKMNASPHNLRSTFAVNLFRALLRRLTPDRALSYVSAFLGHDDLDITIKYLQIAQDQPTGDDIYEDVLDWLGAFDDLPLMDAIVLPNNFGVHHE